MHNIHDLNEYHKYKNTTSDNNIGSSKYGSNGACWIVIGIVAFMLISFISDGASAEAIETLLAFGVITYLFGKWMFS